MKTLSEQLLDLSQRTKHVEDVVAAAQEKNRAKLESQRAELDKSVDATIESGKAKLGEVKQNVQSRWDEARATFDAHVADLRADRELRHAERDVRKAERKAENAEQEAAELIDFALYVLDQTEYAVIDATIARANADELAAA